MKILVTGVAGFIGYHVTKKLLLRGDDVVGLDNINTYYDPLLKESRLAQLQKISTQEKKNFIFIRGNLADKEFVSSCFIKNRFDRVIHLAAQAGVRYSIENPLSYVESNIVAFTNILEDCRYAQIPHLTYASTSSVYGANKKMPFSEHDGANHPLQFYAATKRANELMAHSYSHLFKLPTTGLRFFTVYGPWGRPDMALFKFTKNILEGKSISLYNYGNHTRDFTFVEDLVEGIVRANDIIAESNSKWIGESPDPATSESPFRLYNIGNNKPVKLIEYVDALERALGIKAKIDYKPLQPGDVEDTYADSYELEKNTGYKPKTTVLEGVQKFVSWYKEYYKV